MSADPQAMATPTDTLILVDSDDKEIGSCEKVDCHLGRGKLHRAFSVFLFDPEGRVLIQQRSPEKMLWGGYWANSCCSHPRLGESTDDAARRRTREELGVDTELNYLYKFEYHAEFGEVGSEHELCHVYAGRFDGAVNANPSEISATRFLSADELTTELETNGELYSPWLILEWKRLREDFLADLL